MSTFFMGDTSPLSNTHINHCEEDKLQWGIRAANKRQGKKNSLNMAMQNALDHLEGQVI